MMRRPCASRQPSGTAASPWETGASAVATGRVAAVALFVVFGRAKRKEDVVIALIKPNYLGIIDFYSMHTGGGAEPDAQ